MRSSSFERYGSRAAAHAGGHCQAALAYLKLSPNARSAEHKWQKRIAYANAIESGIQAMQVKFKPDQILLKDIGPIQSADIEFGDLTILVGPQATGKSIFLQWLKLIIDSPFIRKEFRRFSIDWSKRLQGTPLAR